MASELLHHGVGAAPTTPSGLTPARGTGTGLGSAGPRIGWLQVGGRHTRRRGVGRPGVHRSGSGRRPGRVVRDARMRTVVGPKAGRKHLIPAPRRGQGYARVRWGGGRAVVKVPRVHSVDTWTARTRGTSLVPATVSVAVAREIAQMLTDNKRLVTACYPDLAGYAPTVVARG